MKLLHQPFEFLSNKSYQKYYSSYECNQLKISSVQSSKNPRPRCQTKILVVMGVGSSTKTKALGTPYLSPFKDWRIMAIMAYQYFAISATQRAQCLASAADAQAPLRIHASKNGLRSESACKDSHCKIKQDQRKTRANILIVGLETFKSLTNSPKKQGTESRPSNPHLLEALAPQRSSISLQSFGEVPCRCKALAFHREEPIAMFQGL